MPSAVAEAIEYQSTLQGNMWMAGSGALNLALAAYLRASISNPANSGRMIMISQIDVFSTVSAAFAHLWINPTGGTPSTARTAFNCLVDGSSPVAKAVVKTDIVSVIGNNAMTGTDTGIDLPIGPNMRDEIKLPPIILKPGNTLGIGATLAAAVNSAMIIRWMEQPGT